MKNRGLLRLLLFSGLLNKQQEFVVETDRILFMSNHYFKLNLTFTCFVNDVLY